MIGLALAGGGAKGAYEAGAYLALRKCGIKPSIVAGTSIGSINAALIAQGDIKKLINLWENTTSDIFGIDSESFDSKFNFKDIKLTYDNIRKILKNKGIDTTEYFNIVSNAIDEDKLRKSKIKFGLVTVKLGKPPKPIEILIDDIPKGKVAEYILASCYLPVFKFKPIIDNSYYVDGGFYNNIPLDLIEQYGCDTIYAVKVKGIGRNHNKLKKETKIITIEPRKNIGNIIVFDKKTNERNLKLGYYDTLKVIKKLDGNNYYFKNKNIYYYNKMLKNMKIKDINKLKRKYKAISNKELVIKIIEKVLNENGINEFQILRIKKAIKLIKKDLIIKDKELQKFFDNMSLISFI